ncbi:NAD(P)-dependent dehydrogenase, short-chain alcohol dehydrogenase family [Desulfocicer vacuolatum DSM 3385]|uniref:NAD(P)-dependent dehydrogenase, short-chain alcohol dehydrogenase family n=1 Tax=Desulfocicer vacuolatum DSM 3385 TaxID=1121400 RepID=A0A1W2D625_9BACT|nr:SDR family NAD(P)-dependent oxidoreductase [Desulfocicer vacuolatum]SMC92909.1 NAD(P)-dependent dehydrogenase, short-chain alcohol dehydrogenase family [Desulfocicer vacuolatum DSM 3385]
MKANASVAVVTGGASGLGEATVRKMVALGGKAAILDLDESRGAALVEELGEQVMFIKTDVTSEVSVKEAMDLTVERFKGIHVAVNCAGVGTPMKVLSKKGTMPIEKFNQVIQINLIGTMNVVRLAAEKMVGNQPNEDGEKGVIINTASVAAFDGQIGQAAYAASKAAVSGMTLPIAREFADYGIRIMTVAPGLFETPMLMGLPEKAKASLIHMMPFPKRLGYPEEFAHLAQHIIENSMLNGETIRLDASVRLSYR